MPNIQYTGPFSSVTVRDPQVKVTKFARNVPTVVDEVDAKLLLKQPDFVEVHAAEEAPQPPAKKGATTK